MFYGANGKLSLNYHQISHAMRWWFFSSPVNSFFKPALAAIQWVSFHTSCVQTAKALARLRKCAGSPEPSLVAYVKSTIISWAGSNYHQISTISVSLHLPGQSMYAPRFDACRLSQSTSFIKCLTEIPSRFCSNTDAIIDQGDMAIFLRWIRVIS